MKVEILEFVEGARHAQGVTVIIDVFRAFSVACYVADAGAARIIIRNCLSIKVFPLEISESGVCQII